MCVDKIEREKIGYLVCSSCGVVFPDRDDPQNCPICAVSKDGSGRVAGAFVSYVGSKNNL
jgi:rRNA maturation endonuclease Nob1